MFPPNAEDAALLLLCGYLPFSDKLRTDIHCSDSLKSPSAINKVDSIGFTCVAKDVETCARSKPLSVDSGNFQIAI